MQETMPNAELTLLAGRRESPATRLAAARDDDRWPPLHCTLFITGSALACWGVIVALTALAFG
ncbi:MAG: hypothetical protein R3D25_00925 [Geminicoccaceae bacterium]